MVLGFGGGDLRVSAVPLEGSSASGYSFFSSLGCSFKGFIRASLGFLKGFRDLRLVGFKGFPLGICRVLVFCV